MRAGSKIRGERFATRPRRNYHPAHIDFPLRMWICGCMPVFRLNGLDARNGGGHKKGRAVGLRPKKWRLKSNNIMRYFIRLEGAKSA